jgi:hypothetical protein
MIVYLWSDLLDKKHVKWHSFTAMRTLEDVLNPLGKRACQILWLYCCLHSAGCSPPCCCPLLFFWSLACIYSIPGTQQSSEKSFQITLKQLQKGTFQTETNPRNSRGDENCTLAAGPTCCIHMTHNKMSMKLHDIRITFNHL